VALAVRGPSSPRPGRYPAHYPAEFGLSSPGCPVSQAPGSDRPSSCQSESTSKSHSKYPSGALSLIDAASRKVAGFDIKIAEHGRLPKQCPKRKPMKPSLSSAIVVVFAAATLLTSAFPASRAQQPAAPAPAVDMTSVQPESVGFSAQRLERLHAAIQDEINNKQLAGAVTILARHGKIVDYRTYGVRDLATSAPMTKDTIFRDYSMTKPVTGVAMMILYEEGKWLPSDPISKYIPNLRISKSSTASTPPAKCSSPSLTTRPPCASS